MANETMKAADLIGKTITVGDGTAKYVIKSAEGEDKVQTEFWRSGKMVAEVPIPVSQVQKMVGDGVWTISDAPDGTAIGHTTAIHTATEDEDTVEEVSDIVPTKPEPVKVIPMQTEGKRKSAIKREQNGAGSDSAEREQTRPQGKSQPKSEKPKTKGKGKQERKQPQTAGQYVYATYENKRGKVCAKITGLRETDAAYQQADSLHASATYERDKQGGKVLMLLFGPRYATVAKQVCLALNEGKSVSDCQAIVDAATEERHQKREEYKQKRADYLAKRESKETEAKAEPTMTMQEVADLMRRVLAGDADAIRRLNEINAKAA